MSVVTEPFGTTMDLKTISRFTMSRAGVTVSLIEYAAAIQQLLVPDPTGKLADIVLGYDTIEDYELGSGSQGAIIGRHANRIENAEFVLSGKVYSLKANNGRNNLHGGPDGFSRRVWTGKVSEGQSFDAVHFTLTSPDGDQGFPGNLVVEVIYLLNDDGELTLDYKARSDKETVVNLTNHVYFNLAGQPNDQMVDQVLMIPADFYTVVNDEGLPNGEIRPVDGTAFDFREPKPIGRDIEASELHNVGGYDHNWVIPGPIGTLRTCATVVDPASSRWMDVLTTMPGVQFYSANFLKKQTGKSGSAFGYRCGFCLETHYYPNALRHHHFPSPILKAGETYHHTTVLRFQKQTQQM